MSQFARSVSLRDLISDGTAIQSHEAVTIVQQVCRYLAWKSSLGEPIRVPPLEEIRIDAAGEAAITDLTGTDGPLSVADLARLLEQLLPAPGRDQRRAVPGPLRFTIARALGEVDAHPFASAAEFSAALARFERDAPLQAIGALFDRWRNQTVSVPTQVLVDGRWAVDGEGFRERRSTDDAVETRLLPVMRVDRRRHAPSADAFRVMLRDADQRAFETAGHPQETHEEIRPGDQQPWQSPARDRRARTPDAATFRRMLREADRAMWERHGSSLAAERSKSAPPALVAVPVRPRDANSGEAPVVETASVASEPLAAEPEVAHEPLVSRFRTRPRWLAAAAVLLLALAIPVGWRAVSRSQAREKVAGAPASVTPSGSATAAATATAPPTQPPPSASESGKARGRDAAAAATGGRSARGETGPTPVKHATSVNSAPPQLVLASNPGDPSVFSPSFASTESAVFFHEGQDRGGALMRADTSPEGAVLHVTSIVNDGANNYHVRLSPDGQSIVFDSDRDGVRGVYIATHEGKNVRRISGEGYAAVPSWSPDGGRLAFVKAEPGKPQVWNLWVHDLATAVERRLTDYSYGQPWGGSWFADGRRICYSHEDAIYVLDIESGKTKRYPSPIRGRLARTPAVSPDGRRVVFQVYRDGAWLLDLADGSMRRILADPTAEEFTWAPDGRRVAFHSQRAGGWALWMLGM